MRNFTQLLVLAMLVSFSSCEDEKSEDPGMNIGKLYISKSKPQPGETINIKYSGETSDETETTVNYLVNTTKYPADIEFRDSAGVHNANLQIPDSVQAIAFNFKNGDVYEANDQKGYVISLYDENGKEIKGAGAAKGIYYAGASEQFNVKIDKDSALAMIEKDLEKNPELVSEFEVDYSNVLMRTNREKGQSYIDERIAYYSKKDSLTAEEYEALFYLYDHKGAEKESDSINKIAIEKYSKSKLAQRDLMFKVFQAKDQQEKLKYFNQYEENIGAKNYFRNTMLRLIADGYVNEKDWKAFNEYVAKMDDLDIKASLFNNTAWNMAQEDENLEKAAELSQRSLKLIQESLGNYENKPDFFSRKQFDRSLKSRESLYADTYAYIQYKQGDLQGAIETQKNALTENSGSDMTTRYVKYLLEAEQYNLAQEKAEEFMVDNRADAEMQDYLKTAYAKNDNSENFETYLAGIEDKALQNTRTELEKNMLSEEAPSFQLKDLKGNEIELSSLKGKTVILDFWATWCGPCKMSFPGMQKAIDKFANNKNVEFLFVNTWETGEDRNEKVTNFIEENEYDFNVLMDEPVAEGSRDFSVVSEYGIKGIPTKIIIGPDGMINFKKVGYSGNNEKLLKEIGIMIELTQKKKEPEA
ncbi:TlpA disulfide reductase family protein [Christiangramia echinicola]|uniref:Peroxiredoxin n=1 Tax=Christiangramia echinicola TaxID=279359 RepID=A0A1H1PM59_9FLAO|nr:TlpA disulfide reductase family protein [Christiangramia echinicola]SDS12177.1 Peroxiredoxin [Christiangramia echinicola]